MVMMLVFTPISTKNINAGSKESEHLKINNIQPETNLLSESSDRSLSSYKSISQAANLVRNKIVDHIANVSVYIKTAIDDPKEVYSKFREELTKITDNSNEGDYMHWDFKTERPSYVFYSSTVLGKKYYFYYFNIDYSYYTTLEQRRQVDYRVREIIKNFSFDNETTDYQKIKAIYDYVCRNVNYARDTGRDIAYTSWGALFEKEAVCQGYAQLMYKMLKEVGIQVRLIPGFGMSEMHGWNIVKLGNCYYNIDATWDAQNIRKGLSYKYFLKGDKFPDHIRMSEYNSNEFYSNYPMATDDYGINIQKASLKSRKAAFNIIKPEFRAVSRKKIKLRKVGGAYKYEIIYSTDKRFKKGKKTVKTKKTSLRLKKLKKKKKYYLKFRAYCYISKIKVYTQWSSKRKIKAKK